MKVNVLSRKLPSVCICTLDVAGIGHKDSECGVRDTLTQLDSLFLSPQFELLESLRLLLAL